MEKPKPTVPEPGPKNPGGHMANSPDGDICSEDEIT